MNQPQQNDNWVGGTVTLNTVQDLSTGIVYMATVEGNLVPIVNVRSGEIYTTRVLRRDPVREVVPTPNDYHVIGRIAQENLPLMTINQVTAQALQLNLGTLNLAPEEASLNAMMDALVEQYLPVLVEQQASVASLTGEALVQLIEQRKGNLSLQHVRCALESLVALLQFAPEENLEFVIDPMALAEREGDPDKSLILTKG